MLQRISCSGLPMEILGYTFQDDIATSMHNLSISKLDTSTSTLNNPGFLKMFNSDLLRNGVPLVTNRASTNL